MAEEKLKKVGVRDPWGVSPCEVARPIVPTMQTEIRGAPIFQMPTPGSLGATNFSLSATLLMYKNTIIIPPKKIRAKA